MEKELYRARETHTAKWIISDGIRWIEGVLQLRDNEEKTFDSWIDCEGDSRSVSHPNMQDKNGKRCFAAMSDQALGGDILMRADGFIGVLQYGKVLCPKSGNAYHGFYIRNLENEDNYTNYDGTIEVISILETRIS